MTVTATAKIGQRDFQRDGSAGVTPAALANPDAWFDDDIPPAADVPEEPPPGKGVTGPFAPEPGIGEGCEEDVPDDGAEKPAGDAAADPCENEAPPELLLRCSRFRSPRSSAAAWQRSSRSFSSVLLSMFSNSTGSCEFREIGATGAWLRILSKTTAVLAPPNGWRPVAIS